jgi:hypothetical protein
MMKFTQHFPSYMEFDPETFFFERTGELLEHPLVDRWSKMDDFYGFFQSLTVEDDVYLMAMFDYKEEYYGCLKWWCTGKITNDCGLVIINDTLIPNWRGKKAIHKTTCWQRKWESIRNDYNDRSIEERKRMLKELGWKENDDGYGIAIYCDCGLKDETERKYIKI